VLDGCQSRPQIKTGKRGEKKASLMVLSLVWHTFIKAASEEREFLYLPSSNNGVRRNRRNFLHKTLEDVRIANEMETKSVVR